MYESWSRTIRTKLDELSLKYWDMRDFQQYGEAHGLFTIINGNTVFFFFFENGIQVITSFSDSCRVNSWNKAQCYEFVNLYNVNRRFPRLTINDNMFRTDYWHGIGQYEQITNTSWDMMLAAAVGSFIGSDDGRYTLVDALKDVCDGNRNPQSAADRID